MTPFATPILYPNPVTSGGNVTLQIDLPTTANVRIVVFTSAFRRVLEESIPNVPAGASLLPVSLEKNGKRLANGIYYVLVTAGGKRWILKLLILG